MVYIIICQKCGEAFEADTASTESICPQCQLDSNFENELINFYPELGVNYLTKE